MLLLVRAGSTYTVMPMADNGTLLFVSRRMAGEILGTEPPGDPVALASEAASVVAGTTGTMSAPDEFLRVEGTVYAWDLPKKGDAPRTAWIVLETQRDRELVVLVGSVSNFIGRRPQEPDEWWPSSPGGMKRVIAAQVGREPSGGTRFDLDPDAARAAAGTAGFVSVGLSRADADRYPRAEVLLRRYADVDGVDVHVPFRAPHQFERVIVGAALAIWTFTADRA